MDLHELYARWGRRLQQRRQGRYTQRQLATVVGVTQATISKYETGDLCPPDKLKVRLAGALHASIDELFPWPIDLPSYPA